MWWLGYRLGFAPWDTGRPIPMVVEAVEGPDRMTPGRALDLGCGTGRNAIYLARQGWDDVTRLDELSIGRGFELLVDSGCYHAVPTDRRDAYATGVTAVAAPGARLLMFGVGRAPVPGAGVTEEELRRRFTGWRLVSAIPMSADELRGYMRTGRRFEAAMARRRVDVWRYRLELAT